MTDTDNVSPPDPQTAETRPYRPPAVIRVPAKPRWSRNARFAAAGIVATGGGGTGIGLTAWLWPSAFGWFLPSPPPPPPAPNTTNDTSFTHNEGLIVNKNIDKVFAGSPAPAPAQPASAKSADNGWGPQRDTFQSGQPTPCPVLNSVT